MTMTRMIALSRIHYPVTQLGPGRRVGIWLQGCSIRCAGCISMDTWAQGRGVTTVEEVLTAITPWAAEAQGFTVSGGEPFQQPDALAELLRGIVAWRSGRPASGPDAVDILVYTGYTLSRLRRAEWSARLLALCDAVVKSLSRVPMVRIKSASRPSLLAAVDPLEPIGPAFIG